MIIDAHQHAFWHGKDDHGLVADLDAQGIAKAWLLAWDIPPDQDEAGYHSCLNPEHVRPDGTHAGIPLSDLLRAREHYPDRFLVGYCPNPALGHPAATFESAYRIHGVRLCGEWKYRMLFDDPRCLELFRCAGRLGCPVTLHLDIPYLPDGKGGKPFCRTWYGGTVENLERALIACPQTTFIGHAPGFWREISGDADSAPGYYPKGPITPGARLPALFERYSNLMADLSAGSALGALKRDPKHATEFLIRFADRLLFARDYYGSDLNDFLKTLKLPKKVREQVYSGNALRLMAAAEAGAKK